MDANRSQRIPEAAAPVSTEAGGGGGGGRSGGRRSDPASEQRHGLGSDWEPTRENSGAVVAVSDFRAASRHKEL